LMSLGNKNVKLSHSLFNKLETALNKQQPVLFLANETEIGAILNFLGDPKKSTAEIEALTESISLLWKNPKLLRLSLHECNIAVISDVFVENMSNLVKLNLTLNKLVVLPKSFSKFSKLEVLGLDQNLFDQIPLVLFEIQLLNSIRISGNKLTSIPNEISKLKNLTYFRTDLNQLTSICPEISNLPNLTVLNLDGNNISSFDFQGSFPSLKELSISRNKLKEFPSKTAPKGCFPKLERLHLIQNEIENWNEGIMGCERSLELVDLSMNKFTNIDFVSSFLKLSNLNCSLNNITKLPDLSKLNGLQCNFSFNDIDQFPENINEFKLHTLNLTGNPAPVEKYSFDIKFLRSYPMIPDQILENLYLGCYEDAKNKHLLKKLGITHIISVLHEPNPMHHPEVFSYLHIRVYDLSSVDLQQHFDECHKFILEGMKNGKVLVHCAAGISRSATVVISFIMLYKKMKFDEALEFVRLKRGIIDPNASFVRQLKSFEKQLLEREQKEQVQSKY